MTEWPKWTELKQHILTWRKSQQDRAMALILKDWEDAQVGLGSKQAKSRQTWGSCNLSRNERAWRMRKFCQGWKWKWMIWFGTECLRQLWAYERESVWGRNVGERIDLEEGERNEIKGEAWSWKLSYHAKWFWESWLSGSKGCALYES